MGITIHASGKIDRIDDIPRLIDDLKGAAIESNWKYHIIDDDFGVRPNAVLTRRESVKPTASIEGSLGLKGIILNVDPKAEPLAILFDCNGVLTDMMQQLSWIHDNEQGDRFTTCKTQFADIDAHIRIIELLDTLKKKYVSNLSVSDEGSYWESRDRRLLAEKRIALGHCLRFTEKVISSIEVSGDEAGDAESIASRIEEALLKSEKEDG
ncbi:MAG TPA: hypothetical protein VI958_11910 [Acidobacteriota bacterium]